MNRLLFSVLALASLYPSPALPHDADDETHAPGCAELDDLVLQRTVMDDDQALDLGWRLIRCRHDFAGAMDQADFVSARRAAAGRSIEEPDVALLAGTAHQGLQQFEEAVSHYTIYLQSDPQNWVTFRDRIVCRMGAQQWQEASAELEDLLLVPGGDHWENHLLAARSWREMGVPEAAVAEFELASNNPEATLVVSVEEAECILVGGSCAFASDVLAAARQKLIDAHTDQPDSARAFPPEWRLRAASIMKAGNLPGWQTEFTGTISDIDARAKINKPAAPLHALRAFAALQMDQQLRARADAEEAWRLANNQPSTEVPPATTATEALIRGVLGESNIIFRPLPNCLEP